MPGDSYEEVGIQRFRLKGVPLWDVQVHNDTSIDSQATFDAYVAFREGALRSLAEANPDRVVEVVLVPDKIVAVSDFLTSLPCQCEVGQLTADVFADDVWVMMASEEMKAADSSTSSLELESRLRTGVSTVMDMYPELKLEDLTVAAHSIRVSVEADVALNLTDAPNILLVDAVSDTQDFFAGRAANLTIMNTPDVFYWYAAEELGIQLKPTTIVPVGSED